MGRLKRFSIVAGLACVLMFGTGADHREAPNMFGDPQADLLDFFAFVNPNDTTKLVLAVTVNPFIIPGTPSAFGHDLLYSFKIDNDGDAEEDKVIQTTFSKVTRSPAVPSAEQQTFTLVGPVSVAKATTVDKLLVDKTGSLTIKGPANGTVVTGSNGFKVFAGERDDPFFFDFIYVTRFLGIAGGGPVSRSAGVDFFAGMNCSVLMVELPINEVKGTGNNLQLWATVGRATSTKRSSKSDDNGGKPAKAYVQIERNGMPVTSTVLVRANSGALKDQFNRDAPAGDFAKYGQGGIDILTAINNDATASEGIAKLFFPDVLHLDVTKTDGFPNGRRPQDDEIDFILNAASKGAVPGDGVNQNDVPFLTDFPFFGLPHGSTEIVPARN